MNDALRPSFNMIFYLLSESLLLNTINVTLNIFILSQWFMNILPKPLGWRYQNIVGRIFKNHKLKKDNCSRYNVIYIYTQFLNCQPGSLGWLWQQVKTTDFQVGLLLLVVATCWYYLKYWNQQNPARKQDDVVFAFF